MMGDAMIQQRIQNVRKARDANRKFIEAVIEDLPDFLSAAADDVPRRPVAEFQSPADAPPLPASSYGSVASVFLHLFRDWSAECEHVGDSTYRPAVEEVKKFLPKGGTVLLPGAGLGRLALELASEGYKVEANDASRLFLTFADYIMNRPPAEPVTIMPLAHVFSENYGAAQQYMEIQVPSPHPETLIAKLRQSGSNGHAVSLVPGDFVQMYGKGCVSHRKFDCLVTCFFIDTAADVAELFAVLDDLLAEGGIWVNIGPLNWRKEARLKLSWEEIKDIWERKGYEFLTNEKRDCDYHQVRGQKMYTETYFCSLTAAVKRGSSNGA